MFFWDITPWWLVIYTEVSEVIDVSFIKEKTVLVIKNVLEVTP
jgi:hypothetical protein